MFVLQNPTNPILRSYDIFAVRPTTEKAFHAACLTVDGVDIISIDLTQKLPFQLKRPYIVGALARGISFEITIAPSLRGAIRLWDVLFENRTFFQVHFFVADANARKNVIGNIFSLLRFSHGKGVIVASEAQRPIEMRSPADCINLFVPLSFRFRSPHVPSNHCIFAMQVCDVWHEVRARQKRSVGRLSLGADARRFVLFNSHQMLLF
jgi:hypothetical protein